MIVDHAGRFVTDGRALMDDFTREVKRSLCTAQPTYLTPPEIG
jgi:hypothetical protein